LKKLQAAGLAYAWLILRFIDTDTRFIGLDRPEGCPGDALGFDFDGATYSHVGSASVSKPSSNVLLFSSPA